MREPLHAPRQTRAGARLARCVPPGVERHRADDRAAWLAMRRQDVTASVIAALVGEHPYMTRLGLYALKTGQVPDAEAEPVIAAASISLPPLLRGTVLEPVAPALLALLRPAWSVEACGWYYRDPAARIGATPDFVAIDPARAGVGSIQVKTTDPATFRRVWCRGGEEDGEVSPPLFIAIQAVVEAVLGGFSWAEVGVMVSGTTLDLHLVPIPLHVGIMERLRTEVAAFWCSVAAGEMPEADHGRDAEVLAALYPQDNGCELDASGDDDLADLLLLRDGHKATMQIATAGVDRIDTALKARLGEHESLLAAGGRRVTWRTESRTHRFIPRTDTRVLRVSQPREEPPCRLPPPRC